MHPRPLAYRVMYLQTKISEQIQPLIVSDKEKEKCICKTVQILSYWNQYFLSFQHKCTLNNLKKRYQEKWENAYLRVNNVRASRALRRALDPDQYWLTLLAPLCFTTLAKSQKKFLCPPWPNPGSDSAPEACCYKSSGLNRVGMVGRGAGTAKINRIQRG